MADGGKLEVRVARRDEGCECDFKTLNAFGCSDGCKCYKCRLVAENRLLRDDLRMAWLMVRRDASDAPGRISTAIRPFLESALLRHGISLEPAAQSDDSTGGAANG